MNENHWIIKNTNTLRDAIQSIANNGTGCVLVVNSKGQCIGSISDGDIRKWLIENSNISAAEIEAQQIMNKSFFYVLQGESITIEQLERYKLIPVLGTRNEIIKVKSKHAILKIGKTQISKDNPSYIIAEIGNNHQGSIDLAFELVDNAIKTGVNAVKFQHRNLAEVYRENEAEDLGVEYVKNLLSKYSLSWEELAKVMSYARTKGVDVLCTPFDIKSAAELIAFGIDGIKIASADLTNHELLNYCGQSGIPMLISTGMSTEKEIIEAANLLSYLRSDYAFLHCNSTYPAPFEDINLNFMHRLRALGLSDITGWSGHERGYHVCIAAVAKGAKIIEKHFTLDKNLEGNDHKVSLLPKEFNELVSQIREVESSLGNGARIISQGEMINRENLSKSIVARIDLKPGMVLSREMVDFKSPGRGLQPNRLKEFLGLPILNSVRANDFIYESTFQKDRDNLSLKDIKGLYYGIPVRYHDVNHASGFGNMIEFHLTYNDLSRNQALEELQIPSNIEYCTVHAPEMFSDDRLLNLASQEETEFYRSIQDMELVLDIADKLRIKTGQDVIYVITNIGGFSKNDFEKDTEAIQSMYQRVKHALSKLDRNNVEIIIQTMPPYPWHFGGQAFHNLFVHPDEIVKFCSAEKRKICLDLSHTYLACTFLGLDFYDAIMSLMPFTQHLHISDAEGLNGEGLQIGEGEINWSKVSSIVANSENRNLSLIPEVWQGHKDNSIEAKRGLITFINRL